MVNPDRGDYTASFKGKKDSYVLTMTPKNLDAQHRSFYAEDDGKIHADEIQARRRRFARSEVATGKTRQAGAPSLSLTSFAGTG